MSFSPGLSALFSPSIYPSCLHYSSGWIGARVNPPGWLYFKITLALFDLWHFCMNFRINASISNMSVINENSLYALLWFAAHTFCYVVFSVTFSPKYFQISLVIFFDPGVSETFPSIWGFLSCLVVIGFNLIPV